MVFPARWVLLATASALILFGGTKVLRAATAPEVTAVTTGVDAGTNRIVVTLLGKSLTKFTGFTLKDTQGTLIPGTVDTLVRGKSMLVLCLPSGIPPGDYDLTPALKTGDGPVVHLKTENIALFQGTFGTGAAPPAGPGTRMLWYAGKGAFRAGAVDGTQWDDAGVGNYSVATGYGTIANGNPSTATGYRTTASGSASTAMGYTSVAGGTNSTAMGSNTSASGNSSTAMGDYAVASGAYSTAMGEDTAAIGDNSTAMGDGTTAGGFSSTAMGEATTASGFASMATGQATIASGNYSMAMGYGTTAGAIESTAMGLATVASGWRSVAMGTFTTSQAYGSLVLGRYNVLAGTVDNWVAGEPVLVVGNGTSSGSRSNAFTLLKDGTLTIAGTLTQNSDERLKKDIVPLAGVLAKIAHLRGVTYSMKDPERGPDGKQIGLLAQEVRAAFPELVHGDSQGTLSVAYGSFSAVLLEAVKEQQAALDSREKEITALRKELSEARAATEARLARLETLLPAK